MKWKNKLDPVLTKICLYIIGTIAILYVLYHAGNSLFSLLMMLIKLIGTIFHLLVPVFWGFFLAYLLMPITDFLQKKLAYSRFNKKNKSCRGFAVALTIMIIAAFFVAMLSILITSFTSTVQIADLDSTMKFFKGISDSAQNIYNSLLYQLKNMNLDSKQIQDGINAVVSALTNWFTGLGKNMFTSLEDLPGILSRVLLSVIFAIWFLLDGAHIAIYWGKVACALFSDETRQKIGDFLEDVDRVFSGYVRGQMLDALLMMIILSVTLSLCKVPFAVPIGVLAGFGNLIPYVGPFVAYVGVIIVCAVKMDLSKMIISLIMLWIVQSVDGNIINPKLLGSNVHIHPMYVIIALIIGSGLGGLLGMLFAVPIAALIKLQFDRAMAALLKRRQRKEQEKESSDSE